MRLSIALLLSLLTSLSVQADAPRIVVQTGHAEYVRSVAFSADGNTALTTSNDRTAVVLSASGLMVTTRKIAARDKGAETGCGTGAGLPPAVIDTHSIGRHLCGNTLADHKACLST